MVLGIFIGAGAVALAALGLIIWWGREWDGNRPPKN